MFLRVFSNCTHSNLTYTSVRLDSFTFFQRPKHLCNRNITSNRVPLENHERFISINCAQFYFIFRKRFLGNNILFIVIIHSCWSLLQNVSWKFYTVYIFPQNRHFRETGANWKSKEEAECADRIWKTSKCKILEHRSTHWDVKVSVDKKFVSCTRVYLVPEHSKVGISFVSQSQDELLVSNPKCQSVAYLDVLHEVW